MHKKKINQFQTSIMFSNQMCNQNTRFRKRKLNFSEHPVSIVWIIIPVDV